MSFSNEVDVVRWCCQNILKLRSPSLNVPHWGYVFHQTIHVIWSNDTAGLHGGKFFTNDPYTIAKRKES